MKLRLAGCQTNFNKKEPSSYLKCTLSNWMPPPFNIRGLASSLSLISGFSCRNVWNKVLHKPGPQGSSFFFTKKEKSFGSTIKSVHYSVTNENEIK